MPQGVPLPARACSPDDRLLGERRGAVEEGVPSLAYTNLYRTPRLLIDELITAEIEQHQNEAFAMFEEGRGIRSLVRY